MRVARCERIATHQAISRLSAQSVSVFSRIEVIVPPVYTFDMREHRRSRRILASIPLEIESEGTSRQATTAVINLNGALILSPTNWAQDTHLTIRNPDTGLQIRGRVVWCGNPDSTEWYKLGVEFEAASLEFWGARYDPEGVEVP